MSDDPLPFKPRARWASILFGSLAGLIFFLVLQFVGEAILSSLFNFLLPTTFVVVWLAVSTIVSVAVGWKCARWFRGRSRTAA